MEHDVNTLFLDKQLIDIQGGASGVPETESSANILFVNLPQWRVVVNSLTRDTEQLGLRSQGDVWVWHDPLLFASNFHQSQFLHFVVLSVEDANSGSSSVNGQSGTDEGSSGLALQLFSLPNTVDRSNGEVAVDDWWAVDWIESHEVAAIFIQRVELKIKCQNSMMENLRLASLRRRLRKQHRTLSSAWKWYHRRQYQYQIGACRIGSLTWGDEL